MRCWPPLTRCAACGTATSADRRAGRQHREVATRPTTRAGIGVPGRAAGDHALVPDRGIPRDQAHSWPWLLRPAPEPCVLCGRRPQVEAGAPVPRAEPAGLRAPALVDMCLATDPTSDLGEERISRPVQLGRGKGCCQTHRCRRTHVLPPAACPCSRGTLHGRYAGVDRPCDPLDPRRVQAASDARR
jgi:hypothetical protein